MLARSAATTASTACAPSTTTSFGRALITALEHYSEDVWVPELEEAWVRAYAYMADVDDRRRQRGRAHGARLVAGRDRRARAARRRHRGDHPCAPTGPTTTGRVSSPASRRPTGRGRGATTRWPPRRAPTVCSSSTCARSGAGFVSGPLVWRAAVGDELKLGAPMGDMGIDQQSRRDVLVHRRRHRPRPDQGDDRRDDPLEHRAQGHAVLRRPPRGRALRHGRAAPHRWR